MQVHFSDIKKLLIWSDSFFTPSRLDKPVYWCPSNLESSLMNGSFYSIKGCANCQKYIVVEISETEAWLEKDE